MPRVSQRLVPSSGGDLTITRRGRTGHRIGDCSALDKLRKLSAATLSGGKNMKQSCMHGVI